MYIKIKLPEFFCLQFLNMLCILVTKFHLGFMCFREVNITLLYILRYRINTIISFLDVKD